MKAKKTKNWFEKTRFTSRIRIDPKWEEKIRKEEGRTQAEKLDKIIQKYFYGTNEL